MSASATEAQAITRASKSNLALAFVSLPRERRADITVFYAWCRLIDDIADDPGPTVEERRAALDLWRQALREPRPGESTLAAPVRMLIAKYALPPGHFDEIIAGVEMDLLGASYETWEDLRLYCHRVASVVGLVSIEIFGCRDPRGPRLRRAIGSGVATDQHSPRRGRGFCQRRTGLPAARRPRAFRLFGGRSRRPAAQRGVPGAHAFRGGAGARVLRGRSAGAAAA